MSHLARLALIVGAAALGALGVGSGTAAAHTDPCHPLHTCPSDHHSYVWTDANRVGYSCVEPGAPEHLPWDKISVSYGGRSYECHWASGALPPDPAPAPPVPGSAVFNGFVDTAVPRITSIDSAADRRPSINWTLVPGAATRWVAISASPAVDAYGFFAQPGLSSVLIDFANTPSAGLDPLATSYTSRQALPPGAWYFARVSVGPDPNSPACTESSLAAVFCEAAHGDLR